MIFILLEFSSNFWENTFKMKSFRLFSVVSEFQVAPLRRKKLIARWQKEEYYLINYSITIF